MKKYMIMLALASLLLSACSNSGEHDSPIKELGFPKVTEPYSSEQAAENGDVVNVHGKYMNIDKWNQFIENVKNNQADQIRITQYTDEGDPIFYELIFDGNAIQFTYDNSMDAFGSDSGRPTTTCKGIGTKKSENGQEYYVLTECKNDTGDTFWFPKE
ncbi:DUF4362 domain-containing protein [Paenibacillus marinisediminis]